MPIKFRNRYLICTLTIKDPTLSFLKSVTKQTLVSSLLDRLEALCGDVLVGRVRASLTIKECQVVDEPNASGGAPHVVFLVRTRRDCLREVWLALTCVMEVDRRVARITVDDVSGGIERVKERYLERAARGMDTTDGKDYEELRRRVMALET
jgi:RNase P/RNase MRP subunit POP5